MNRCAAIATLALCAMSSASAVASDAYVTSNVHLRSGPDVGYPSVALLRIGTPVTIEGCVAGWAWCDVSDGGDRGWVSGAFLQQEYAGERLGIRSNGERIGIPILSFELGAYWDHHYRNRSWYGEREHWSHVRSSRRPFEETRRARGGMRENSHNDARGDTHGTARVSDDAGRPDAQSNARPRWSDASPNRSATARPLAQARPIAARRNAERNPPPAQTDAAERTREHERDDRDH